MLSFNEIRKHYSDKENKLPQLILKEYLQYKILDIIFSSQYGDKLAFMGGTAIRIVYGGDRFSEDLDIDNNGLSEKDFNKLTKHIKKELEQDGLTVEFRNTFQNVYHCYLKFPKILFDNNLSPLKDEKIMIRLDSFCTNALCVNDIQSHIIAKADVFAEIKTYSESMILSQKIEALFNRKRAKGRDIYDIIYLFSLTEPNYIYLTKVLSIKNKEEMFAKMEQLFTDKQLTALVNDVKSFVWDEKRLKQIEKFNLWIKSNK